VRAATTRPAIFLRRTIRMSYSFAVFVNTDETEEVVTIFRVRRFPRRPRLR
jgi:hypothetical protein